MPFDEEYHVGVIQIYAQQWSPFLTVQPPGSETFGSLVSEPSYLYHYLMSFPYRLLTTITDSFAAQVIILRLLNIGLFVAALIAFRKVMLRVVPASLAHVSLGLMVLVPVVPYLAGQVNYDNALILAVALLMTVLFKLIDDARKRVVSVKSWAYLIALVGLGSLIKYTMLPIAVVAIVCYGVFFYRAWRGAWGTLTVALRKQWGSHSRPLKALLIILVVLSAGLFTYKYGTNVVKYGSPVPKCHHVLNETQCMNFGPWQRNALMAETKGYVDPNPVAYGFTWVEDLTMRLFFTLSGKDQGYATRMPLPIPIAAASIAALGGLVCLAFRLRLLRDPSILVCTAVTVSYAAALFLLDNYPQYLQTGQPVAINGRYFIPLLPLMLAVLGRAYMAVLAEHRRLQTVLADLMLICFLQGGGVLTYIVLSEPDWYWPNQAVIDTNQTAQRLLKPLIVEGSRSTR